MPHGLPARPRVTRPHVAAILVLLGAACVVLATQTTARAAEPIVLPNGLTLELVGVSTVPSRDRPWWAPDGCRAGHH